ncbi:MAG: homocysteine S-methyltransferase family protein [Spirulinaceae cyanobacterium]
MAKYRNNLPQLANNLFLTDGGTETTLVFHEGLDLPYFAAFDLLKDQQGYQVLQKYFRSYANLAKKHQVGFILESVTWRANADWGLLLGYSKEALAEMNHKAITLLEEIRAEYETVKTPMVISGCIGPRGDGYNPTKLMTEEEAQQYHLQQITTFSNTNADLVSAMTITYTEEAIGIAHAAKSLGIPVVISFTLETDGKLPTGQTLKEAITQVDESTNKAPAYYMINCAHPTHFADVLVEHEPWLKRVRGIRANASTKSHAELDEAEELDDGNPVELATQYRKLRNKLPNLNVLGGCCGTDIRHVEAIYQAYLPVTSL